MLGHFEHTEQTWAGENNFWDYHQMHELNISDKELSSYKHHQK